MSHEMQQNIRQVQPETLTLGQLVKELGEDHPAAGMVARVGRQVGFHAPVAPEAVEMTSVYDGQGKKVKRRLFHALTANNGRPASHCSRQDRGPKEHLHQWTLKNS